MTDHTDILGPVDTAFWSVETDETPMNLGGVLIFDGKMDFDELVRLLKSRIHQAPRYQKRVIVAPMNLGSPTWAFDPDFQVENHVFKMQLEAPGTDEQFRKLTGQLVSGALDREKPLWELYFVEGLEGNRTGIVFKVHHCMVDGLSAVELFTIMLDFTPETRFPDAPAYTPPELPNSTQKVVDAVRSDVPFKFNLLKKLGNDALQYGTALLDREQRRDMLLGLANLISDNLTPTRALKSINGKNSGEQSVAWAEFPLADIKAIRKKHGVSVNDVMLTLYSAGIAKYLEAHNDDSDQDYLRVIIPVNMRQEGVEDTFGNRISMLPIDIDLALSNPVDRLKAVSKYTQVMKNSNLSVALDVGLTLPMFVPSVAQPLVWAAVPKAIALLAHTWCTNVPGPQIQLYMLGLPLRHVFGFFPINPSMGIAAVIVSFNGKISINLVTDNAIISDSREIRGYVYDTFEELLSLSGLEPSEPINRPIDTVDVVTSNDSAEDVISPPSEEKSVASDDSKEPETEKITANGKSEVIATVELAEKEETPSTETVANEQAEQPQPAKELEIFSDEWAKAFMNAINNNKAYHKASTKWRAGKLAFVMRAAPAHNIPEQRAVILDLHEGVCRDAMSVPVAQAKKEAAFVLESDYDTWMNVLSGKSQPIPLLMTNKLNLKKGSRLKLLPFRNSATELVASAQKI